MSLPASLFSLAVAFAGLPAQQSPDAAAHADADADAAKTQPDPGLAVALQLEQSFVKVAESAFESIVTVTSYERDPGVPEKQFRESSWLVERLSNDYPGYRKMAVTSGVVLNEEGHILGCRHGIVKPDGSLADLVSVETQDQQHTICAILGSEPTLNLSVLKMQVFNKQLPPRFRPAKLGDSSKVRPGLWAIGCGDPDGPEMFFGVGTFTSVPDRDCYQEQLAATYMQAAMKVHPKAYGGALLNVRGEVMGILCPRLEKPGSTKQLPHYGIEFALPSNIVQNLYKAIIQAKSHRSPWIGVAVMSRPELIRERGAAAFGKLDKPRHGIYIENVFDPSPAFAAGIRPGDFMMQLNANLIRTPLDFQKYMYLAGIGSKTTFKMWRDGKERDVVLPVEPRPQTASFR